MNESFNSAFLVRPTGQAATEQYSDVAMTGLFNACVSVANSERQAIWQRYNAVLIANSLVFGFTTNSLDNAGIVVPSCVLGIVLCGLWWFMTVDGWKFFDIFCRVAAEFSWPAIDARVNPISLMYDEFEKVKGDRIKWASLGVIAAFVVGYVSLGLWASWAAYSSAP